MYYCAVEAHAVEMAVVGFSALLRNRKDFECACGIAIYTRIIINLLWFTGLLGGVQISGL